jgi:hypothetical protein
LELLETEKNYYYRLDIICHHFVTPLKKEASNAGFINLDQINGLFSCIEGIKNVSKLVRDELLIRIDSSPINNATSIGAVLLDNIVWLIFSLRMPFDCCELTLFFA